MNILAVDCCLRLTGAALLCDDVITSEQGDFGRRQSQELPRMVDGLMKSRSLSWDSLDCVAITNGPGYFTGIRVGAAYASGIAYASGCGVVPVSTFDVLSRGIAGEKVLSVIYAGHDYVYACCDNYLAAGEYSHSQIYSWLANNPDAKIISDDPERTALKLDIISVTPDVKKLCEIAREKVSSMISPMNLRMSYYRAPQGVN